MYLLDLFEGMGKKGNYDLASTTAPVGDWVNASLCWCLIHVNVILILWGAGLVLRKG